MTAIRISNPRNHLWNHVASVASLVPLSLLKHGAQKDKKVSMAETIQFPFSNGHDLVEFKGFDEGSQILSDLLRERTTQKGPTHDYSSRQHLNVTLISFKDDTVGTLTIYDICGIERSEPSVSSVAATSVINQHNAELFQCLRERYLTGNPPTSIPRSTFKTEMSPLCNVNHKLIVVPHFDLNDNLLRSNKFVIDQLQQLYFSYEITHRDKAAQATGVSPFEASVWPQSLYQKTSLPHY